MKRGKRHVIKNIKVFFFAKGKINPLRYLITVYSHLCIVTVLLRMVGINHITDEFVGIMVALIPSLIATDTWRQNHSERYGAEDICVDVQDQSVDPKTITEG